MEDFQFKILTISLVFILLIICISSYYYTKWLDINHNNKGRREISIADLSGIFFLNFLASMLIFFMIITGYALICNDIGLINDDLYELNEYLSFIPLKFDDNDRYPEPIILLRHLDKFNCNPVILGALIINQLCSYLVCNVLVDYPKIQVSHVHGVITLIINVILWFLTPYSLTVSLFSYSIIYVIILRVSRIDIIIEGEENNE